MKKFLFIAATITFSVFLTESSTAQNGGQQDKVIQTEHGTLTVKTNTENGLGFIDFAVSQWNTIMNGTDQVVTEGAGRFPAICIEIPIATRPACIGGIGFRCGIRIYICDQQRNRPPSTDGRNADRFYWATYQKIDDSTVRLSFNENVDWDWLSL